MTKLLVIVLGFLFAYSVYIAALTARRSFRAEDYLDGDATLPDWCYMFAGTAVVLACANLYDHYLLVAEFGFPYNQTVISIVVAALAGILIQKRVWLAARLTGLRTLGELLGSYYGSHALRTVLLLILVLFTIPFTAEFLSRAGLIISMATNGAVPRVGAIWGLAFFLFLSGAIGGWRATIYVIAGQLLLVLTLIAVVGVTGAVSLHWLAGIMDKGGKHGAHLVQKIADVMGNSGGVGAGEALRGVWSTTAILSASLALIGVIVSPAFVFLGVTTKGHRGFAFKQVWMTAALAAGIALLFGPLIGAGIVLGNPGSLAGGSPSYHSILVQMKNFDYLLAVGFVLMLVASLQIAISFFAQSGASIFVIELLGRFVLPDMTPSGRRLAARISLAIVFLLVASMSSFAPLATAVVGSSTLALAVQLLPALVGLCWVRWISRSAVLTGLIFGALMVFLTDPLGLVVLHKIGIDVPWGRWPLTIHSAGWGLAFNVVACLLVSIFTRGGSERKQRDRLHDVFYREHRQDFGGRGARGAKWSLTLLWAFFALGPGAILGNWAFSQAAFGGSGRAVALPSLWVWQILLWLIGVFIAWWLAYRSRMSLVEGRTDLQVAFESGRSQFSSPTPRWMELLVERIARW